MERFQSFFRPGQRAEKAKDVFFDALNISNQCKICPSSKSENEQLKEELAVKEAEILVLRNRINELENDITAKSPAAATSESSTQTVQTNSENMSPFATQGAISKLNGGKKRHSSEKSGLKPFSSKNSKTHTFHTLDFTHGPYGRFQAPLKPSPSPKPTPPPPVICHESYPVLKQLKSSLPQSSSSFLASTTAQPHPGSVLLPPSLPSIPSKAMAPSSSQPQPVLPTFSSPFPKHTGGPNTDQPSPPPPCDQLSQPSSPLLHKTTAYQPPTQEVPSEELTSDQLPRHSSSHKEAPSLMSQSQFSRQTYRAKKVFIYGDSNYQTRHRQLRSKIRELQTDGTEKYDITFVRSYTLEKTLVEMQKHDHNNAIVVIATLTNNIRYNQSLTTISRLQGQIIEELKKQTDQKNIVFLACPPTRFPAHFDTHMSNCYTEVVCEREGVRFSESLVKEQHLYLEDGIHVDYEHQDLITRSVAAAIINSSI